MKIMSVISQPTGSLFSHTFPTTSLYQGLNVEKEQISNNAFHARNSLITVIYNYFGYSVFGSLMPFWTKLGLLDKCFRSSLVSLLIVQKRVYQNGPKLRAAHKKYFISLVYARGKSQ